MLIFSKTKTPQSSNTTLYENYDDVLLMEEGLNILIDIDREYYGVYKEHMVSMYYGLKESNAEILTEGFKDFIDNAVEFFKKMITKIKEFFKRSFTIISSYIGNFENFIKKNKDLLNSIDPKEKFEVECYEGYTFKKEYPKMDKFKDTINKYNNEVDKLEKKTKGEITTERNTFMNENNLDKIRAEVIGESTPIPQEKYVEAVEKSYRVGSKESRAIDRARLQKAIIGYEEMNRLLKTVQKERDDFLAIMDRVLRFFEKTPDVYYGKGTSKVIGISKLEDKDGKYVSSKDHETSYSTDTMANINAYYNFKYAQSKALAEMVQTAFYGKVAAIKESLNTDKEIIRKSLHFIHKDEKKGDDK